VITRVLLIGTVAAGVAMGVAVGVGVFGGVFVVSRRSSVTPLQAIEGFRQQPLIIRADGDEFHRLPELDHATRGRSGHNLAIGAEDDMIEQLVGCDGIYR
jgi:hypothetical protein